MMKVMVDAIKSLKVGRYLVKSFISITLTCFRSLASVRMAEEGTDDVLYLGGSKGCQECSHSSQGGDCNGQVCCLGGQVCRKDGQEGLQE